jgi:hypothetical protein
LLDPPYTTRLSNLTQTVRPAPARRSLTKPRRDHIPDPIQHHPTQTDENAARKDLNQHTCIMLATCFLFHVSGCFMSVNCIFLRSSCVLVLASYFFLLVSGSVLLASCGMILAARVLLVASYSLLIATYPLLLLIASDDSRRAYILHLASGCLRGASCVNAHS